MRYGDISHEFLTRRQRRRRRRRQRRKDDNEKRIGFLLLSAQPYFFAITYLCQVFLQVQSHITQPC